MARLKLQTLRKILAGYAFDSEGNVSMSTDLSKQTESDPQEGQLTTTQRPQGDGRMAIVEALAGLGEKASLHNFEGSPAQVWRMVTLGENKSTPGNDLVGKGKVSVTNWYLHRIRLEDAKTGEISEPVRTVLYTKDGGIYHFVSDGIVKAMAGLIKTFGIGPYDPPIDVEVLEIRTNNGFKMMTLAPAE